MGMVKGFFVDASAERAWEVLFKRFDEIYIWCNEVENSVPDPDLPIGQGRLCEIGGLGILKDTMSQFNENAMTFTVIRTGYPLHIKQTVSTWSVESPGGGQCMVQNEMEIELKESSTFLFRMAFLRQIEEMRQEMIQDFCCFAETGRVRRKNPKR